jgi:sulfur transfer protein SufE|tara:strand:+ start:399 stop:812 length:414 start_codon:yes stop_codon:yes gene_type:complete
MIIDSKLNKYKSNIETLKEIESLEVYRWLISLGEKLQENPLSKEKRINKNKVDRCQFDLFVDREDNMFKAWSNAMVAGGYAYILLDIFNSLPIEEAKKITVEHFKKIKLDELLTMNRKTGFYQMIEMMIERIKYAGN